MKIKKVLIFIILSYVSFTSQAQNDTLPDLEAYFSALIVNDIERSIAWYSDNLGFIVLQQTAYKEMGFKQANLKRGHILIELIELGSAISIEDVVKDYNNKTRLIGFFKIGFLVSDFEKWLTHLQIKKVDFHGRVVTDDISKKRMVIIKDVDGNRIQIFEK